MLERLETCPKICRRWRDLGIMAASAQVLIWSNSKRPTTSPVSMERNQFYHGLWTRNVFALVYGDLRHTFGPSRSLFNEERKSDSRYCAEHLSRLLLLGCFFSLLTKEFQHSRERCAGRPEGRTSRCGAASPEKERELTAKWLHFQ